MRILITNTGPWGTGSGTVADGIMKELKRRDHKVMAFFPDSGRGHIGYIEYGGKRIQKHLCTGLFNRQALFLAEYRRYPHEVLPADSFIQRWL